MALFLNETVVANVIDTYISIEEAYDGLLEASLDMHELTEAMLQADFIIHEKGNSITESAYIILEENFLIKAAQKIKEFIIKVRDKVVVFFKRIGEIIKQAWERIVNNNRGIILPVGSIPLLDKASAELTTLQKVSQNIKGAIMYKKAVDTQRNITKKAVDSVKTLFSTDGKTEMVSADKLKKFFALTTAVAAVGVGAKVYLSKRAKEVEDTAGALEATEKSTDTEAPKKRKVASEKAKEAQIIGTAQTKVELDIASAVSIISKVISFIPGVSKDKKDKMKTTVKAAGEHAKKGAKVVVTGKKVVKHAKTAIVVGAVVKKTFFDK